jgi:hypothetical protein
MAKPGTDPGAIGAFLTLVVMIAGAIVGIATIHRTWVTQTIRELKDLTDAQARRIDFLEEQAKLVADQVVIVQAKAVALEQDNLSLVRRNRELSEQLERREGTR